MSLLGEIVDIQKGTKYNLLDDFQEGATRVFQANDFRNEDKQLYTSDSKGVLAEPDDILLVWDGSVGQMGIGRKGYVGSTMVKLTVKDKTTFSPQYIYRFLQTKSELLKRRSTGATIQHISRKVLEGLKVPSISRVEQDTIASNLDKAETIINERKQSIVLLDDFLRSTFLSMFYENPESSKWKDVRFSDLADKKKGSMRTGPFGSSLLHSEFTETGNVKVLGIDNVVSNRFEWKRNRYITFEKYEQLKRYQVYPGDVLISIMATLGRTAVVPNDIPTCINSKHLAAITLDKKIANPYFIAFAFHSHPVLLRQISRKIKGSIMDGLNLTIIQKLVFKLPPVELQNEFAKCIHKTEEIRTDAENSLMELDNLFNSISKQAFNNIKV